MALKLHTTYPGRFDSPSENYPQGKWRNRSNSTAHDGGYLEEKHMNDIYGFFGALLRNAEMSPNGEVDTAKKSQFYDALVEVAKSVVGEEGYRKLGDNVFNGLMTIKSDNDEQGSGILLQESDGTVRGSLISNDYGLQLIQRQEDGSTQTFTFPRYGEGGELLVDSKLHYITPEMFGAVADGVTDSSQPFYKMTDFIKRQAKSFIIKLSAGEYRFKSGWDLSEVKHSFKIEGAGHATVLYLDYSAPSSSFLTLPENVNYTVIGVNIRGGSARKSHPIAIKAPKISGSVFKNVTVSQVGNIAVWASRPFNSDWDTINLMFNGWQPLHKDVPKTLTIQGEAGSNIIRASEDIFDTKDEGVSIIVPQTPSSNNGMSVTITKVNNSREVVISRSLNVTVNDRKLSFLHATGDVSGDILKYSRMDQIDVNDIGRYIFIEGAGEYGETFMTTIKDIVDNQIVLSESAHRKVENAVIYFTPSMVVSGYQAPGQTPINDLVLNNLQVEGYRGLGFLAISGTHLFLNNLKTHGHAYSSNSFAMSGKSLVIANTTRTHISSYELEMGYTIEGESVVTIEGNKPEVRIETITLNGMCYNDSIFTLNVEDSNSVLSVGSILGNSLDYSNFNKLINISNSRCISDVGRIYGVNSNNLVTSKTMYCVQSEPSVWFGSTYVHKIPLNVGAGILGVYAHDTPARSGEFAFSGNSVTKVIGGERLSTVKGTSNSTNVYIEDGYLCIEHISSGGRRYSFSMRGG